MNLDENVDYSSAAHHGFEYVSCWDFFPLLSVQRVTWTTFLCSGIPIFLHCLQGCRKKIPWVLKAEMKQKPIAAGCNAST